MDCDNPEDTWTYLPVSLSMSPYNNQPTLLPFMVIFHLSKENSKEWKYTHPLEDV